MSRLVLTVSVIVLATPTGTRSQSLADFQQRGEVIARGMCSGCHAVGSSGVSPVSNAPAFRKFNRRTADKLAQRLREGLLTGHKGMPIVRFNGQDAEAMQEYVKSIQAP
jgi:mono/diheme cytochrome c family protein